MLTRRMRSDDMGSRVKEERERLGLTQQELADQVSISRNWLSRIECGKVGRVSYTYVVAINTALGIDPHTPVTDSPSLTEFYQAARLPEAGCTHARWYPLSRTAAA